jgi:HlyD family secretion protein
MTFQGQRPGPTDRSADRSNDVTAIIAQDAEIKRKRRIQWWIGIAVVVVLLAVAGYFGRGSGDTQQFATEAARRGDLQMTVIATGKLQPTNQVDVGSEVSGRVDKINVDFNDPVSKDQVLAVMDTEQLEARVTQASAQLAAAEAAQRQAEATANEERGKAKRAEELVKSNFVSEQALETAQASAARADAAVASAKAQVTVAKASLESDQTALRKAVIRSPIDGVVISREVEEGQTLAATFQTPLLFKLAEDLTRMELHLDIDEADIGLVHEGQNATFTVDAFPDQEFPARIEAVRYAPQEKDNVVTYEAVLSVANPDKLLRPGMTATAEIVAQSKPGVLMVANRALRFNPSENNANFMDGPGFRDDQEQVWVLEDGKPKAIDVKTGASNEQWTEITKGEVTPGMELITSVAQTDDTAGK